MVSPTRILLPASDVFRMERPGPDGMVTVSSDGSETIGSPPDGGMPEAVAWLWIEPASTSSAVTTYVAEKSTESPGARSVTDAGEIALKPGNGSWTCT